MIAFANTAPNCQPCESSTATWNNETSNSVVVVYIIGPRVYDRIEATEFVLDHAEMISQEKANAEEEQQDNPNNSFEAVAIAEIGAGIPRHRPAQPPSDYG